ncbi:MAG: hypothetical protein KDD33_05160 [Bdellovibrionales bacterium]|nr:hypothetical protein [Bdellovibrionales bacterium]
MYLKLIIPITLIMLSYSAQAKIYEFVDHTGKIKCEIDSNGHFEIKDGPCFPQIDNFFSTGEKSLCVTESGDEIKIKKQVFRIDNYTVSAYGYHFFGVEASSPGVANGLHVKNMGQAKPGDPSAITFVSNSMGDPIAAVVDLQDGRAPLVEKLDCQAL